MEQILKLSIVLPKQDISESSLNLINWCANHKGVQIVCLIWCPEHQKTPINYIEYLVWKTMLFIESAKLNIKKLNRVDVLKKINIANKLKEFNLAEGHLEAINEINKLEIDIHLALSLEPFLTNIKDNATYGALCFNGDNLCPKTHSPYFFQEVLNKKNKTKFHILHLQPHTGKASIAQQGSLPTHGYFLANQENVLLRQNFYMQRQIEAILNNKIVQENILEKIVVHKIHQAPSLYAQSKYLLHLLGLVIKKLFSLFKTQDVWNVGIYKGDWRSLNFNNNIIISNPKNHFLADPFVISRENKNYCFVEDYDLKKSKGVISVYEINSDSVTNIGVALEEDFHLSFPYLFECDSKIYMLPETADNNDIRLYESTKFPLQWKLHKIIMSNVRAVDSMIFKHNDRWWLFSNINPIGGSDTCSELSLFYSDHPVNGQWLPHTNNPVVFNPSFARNGGIIIEEGCVYRVGQKQIFGTYGGGGFSINKVTELTPDDYKEEPVLLIKPDFFKKNKGAHHFHTNGAISSFDFLT
jgi:hypothetical protein